MPAARYVLIERRQVEMLGRKDNTRRLLLEPLEARRLLAFNPSGLEQEFLQLNNRFRTDPRGELSRLVSRIDPIASSEPNIAMNLAFWKVNGPELARQWQSLTPVPPLAWHESLYNAATGHNQQMIRNHLQRHQFPGEGDPGERMEDAGYDWRTWAENIAAFCTTVLECHAAYAIDWGPGPMGIQSPPQHRINQLNANYRETGIAVTPHTRTTPTDVGPLVSTQDFANRNNFGDPYIVGAVFNDKNNSGWYENGEGLGGATIKMTGPTGTFQTTSMTAGGYQIQLPAGTYTVTASNGGLKEPLIMANVLVGANNVWVNFAQSPNAPTGDRFEPNNTFDTATALATGDLRLDQLSIHLSDNDDVYRWTSPSSGNAKVDATFTHASGNLDLYVFNDAKAEVASSKTTTNRETITWPVTAGSIWYVVVKGTNRATNLAYVLELDSPGGVVPQANGDKTATDKNTPIAINILANDSDPDGDLDATTVHITTQPRNGAVSIDPGTGVVTYTPSVGFLGVDRFGYKVRDKAQLVSQEAIVVLAVVDYSNRPWRNPTNPLDIDASGAVVPLDALVIINQLNERGPGALPPRPTGADSPPGFIDPSGDDFLSSIDALRVINFLNQAVVAEGEGAAAFHGPSTRSDRNVIIANLGLNPLDMPTLAQNPVLAHRPRTDTEDDVVAHCGGTAILGGPPRPVVSSDDRDIIFECWEDNLEDCLDWSELP